MDFEEPKSTELINIEKATKKLNDLDLNLGVSEGSLTQWKPCQHEREGQGIAITHIRGNQEQDKKRENSFRTKLVSIIPALKNEMVFFTKKPTSGSTILDNDSSFENEYGYFISANSGIINKINSGLLDPYIAAKRLNDSLVGMGIQEEWVVSDNSVSITFNDQNGDETLKKINKFLREFLKRYPGFNTAGISLQILKPELVTDVSGHYFKASISIPFSHSIIKKLADANDILDILNPKTELKDLRNSVSQRTNGALIGLATGLGVVSLAAGTIAVLIALGVATFGIGPLVIGISIGIAVAIPTLGALIGGLIGWKMDKAENNDLTEKNDSKGIIDKDNLSKDNERHDNKNSNNINPNNNMRKNDKNNTQNNWKNQGNDYSNAGTMASIGVRPAPKPSNSGTVSQTEKHVTPQKNFKS